MKFSITFKYSNITFKNKETKETVSFDSKAEAGNTFTFDNVDEDVVIGIVKGIKDKKASQVFSYDNLRTNFINVLARNKCKELYDKLDKGGWKVEDVVISSATIKDLEFTKPTMNARENITVESRRKVVKRAYASNTIYINWHWSSEYDSGDSGSDEIPIEDTSEENIKRKVEEFCNKEWPEAGGHCDGVYVEVFVDLVPESEPVFLFDGTYKYGEIRWYDPDDEKHIYVPGGGCYVENLQKPSMDESVEGIGQKMDFQQFADFINSEFKKKVLAKVDSNGTQVRLEVYPNEKKQIEEILNDICGQNGWKYEKVTRNLHYTYYVTYDSVNESKEEVEVEFKKTPEDDGSSVIAFFPQTMHDGSCNPGNIMSYEHNGQHGEASIDFYHDCTTCLEEDYASLLHELEGIYDDCELVVVQK